MELLKKRLANLLTIKSLVTMILTAVFAVLALKEAISGNDFLTVFTVVIAFYFGTQSNKADAAAAEVKTLERSAGETEQ